MDIGFSSQKPAGRGTVGSAVPAGAFPWCVPPAATEIWTPVAGSAGAHAAHPASRREKEPMEEGSSRYSPPAPCQLSNPARTPPAFLSFPIQALEHRNQLLVPFIGLAHLLLVPFLRPGFVGP